MTTKFLKTLFTYIIFFIISIVVIYFFFRITETNSLNVKEGLENKKYTFFDSDDSINGLSNYYRSRDDPQNMTSTTNFRTWNPETINNYYLFQPKLKGKSVPELLSGISINLFTDHFDTIWNPDTDFFKDEFGDAIMNIGYYRSTKLDPDIYISLWYILQQLYPGVDSNYGNFDEDFKTAKDLCAFLCKRLEYDCVLVPIFSKDVDMSEYRKWLFFVLVKHKTTVIRANLNSISDMNTTTDKNTTNPNIHVNERLKQYKQGADTLSRTPQYKNSLHKDKTPDSILSNFTHTTSGIPMHITNIPNVITGITNINALTIGNNGLEMIMCTEDQIKQLSNNDKGIITDIEYIESLSSVEKYSANYSRKLNVKYSENYNVTYISESSNNESNNESSGALTYNYNNGSIQFVDNSIDIDENTTGGYIHNFGRDNNYQWRQANLLKKIPVENSIGLYWNDRSIGFNNPNIISLKHFPKKLPEQYYRLPCNFVTPNQNSTDNSNKKSYYQIDIIYTYDNGNNGNNGNNYSIEIDSDNGEINYMKDGSIVAKIFSIKDYDISLTGSDLVTNHSWTDVVLNTGSLGPGQILGVNGGNREYVMDSQRKMRFWFDIHGTMHIEISLSRYSTSRERILNLLHNRYLELFPEHKIPRSNNIFLNNYNYSGTPYTSYAALMSRLTFDELTLNKPEKDPLSLFSNDEDVDGEIQLFFNPINNSNNNYWAKYDLAIDTNDCNYWFRHSNIYNNSIEIPILNNNDKHDKYLIQTQIGSNIDKDTAIDSCSSNPECYGITCSTNEGSEDCKLWKKDGIQNNYQATPGLSNKTYDAYYKVCPSREQILQDSGFHNDPSQLLFSNTGISILTQPNSNITNGMRVGLEELQGNNGNVVITDLIIRNYVKDNLESLTNPNTNTNTDSWFSVFIKEEQDPRNMNQDAKIDFITNRISTYNNEIQIKFSKQTNRLNFYNSLGTQIGSILRKYYLNPNVRETTRTAENNLNENNNAVITSATTQNNTITGTSRQEGFENLNNDDNDLFLFKTVSDNIIKKIVYNIDNDNIGILGNPDKNSLLNNTILTILLIVSLIILFNIINKK